MTDEDSPKLFSLLNELRNNPITTPMWEYFTNSSGMRLSFRSFTPKLGEIKKAIIGCHGMAAEADYFVLYADQIVEQTGSILYAMDFRGHGRSEGKKGDIPRFQYLLDDLKELTDLIQERHPGIPLFILGESMGGIISLNFAIQNPDLLTGIIEFAPAVRVHMGSFSIKDVFKFIGGFFIYLFKPSKLIFATKGDEAKAIKLESHQRYDFENPHHLEAVSLRYIFQLNKYSKIAFKTAGEQISIPIIIFQGDADKLVSASGVTEFFQTIKSEDKELVIVPDAYHVLTTDPAFVDWGWEKLRTWLNAH